MPCKVDPHNIKADWTAYERRPTWGFVSSRELAIVLGVHLQTISNYKLRSILPGPEPHPRIRGNKNWYRISRIREWLEGRTETEIHNEWIRKYLPAGVQTLEVARDLVESCYKILEVERV